MAFVSCSQDRGEVLTSSEEKSLQRLLLELDIERAQSAYLLQQISISQHRIQDLQNRTKQLEVLASLQCLSDPSVPSEDGLIPPFDSASKYPDSIRRAKIAKYKAKRLKYHNRVRVSRLFTGRSRIARQKLREGGRFIRLPLSL